MLWVMAVLITRQGMAQTDWEFVGPRSTNKTADNGFETAQFNNITIDPYNPYHLFAGSWWGGLWESTDRGANWSPVDIRPMNCNGVSAVTFISNTQVIIGDSYQESRYGSNNDICRTYSKAVWLYNFQTSTWTSLGSLPAPPVIPFCIKSIAVYPGNANYLFVCTSGGLFRSSNAGVSWSAIAAANDWVENILFVQQGGSGNYSAYIAGSSGGAMHLGNDLFPGGTVMVKESTNITGGSPTFTDLSSNFSIPDSLSVAKMCKAPADASNNVQIFLYTLTTDTASFSRGQAYILSFKKNISSGVLSGYNNLTPNGAGSHGSATRIAVAYDSTNNAVWFGGVTLSYFKVNTSQFEEAVYPYYWYAPGYLHTDLHDFQIQSFDSQLEIYVACDGGISRSIIGTFLNGVPPPSPDTLKLYFKNINNGLHMSMVRGFSGSEANPNVYALGGQDIINADIYDAATGKNRYTHQTWENDGALIDKYDDNNMFFDARSYDALYYTSENGGATIEGTKSFYHPAPGNTFTQGNAEGHIGGPNFAFRQFFQDPYRPGRIYHSKSHRGISQYDPVSKTFVYKIEPWLIQPNLDWNCYMGEWKIKSWDAVKGMSFSPETPNSFYFITNGDAASATCPSRPSVLKYIGNNFDDCWNGHNLATYTDGAGTHSQWQNITPSWRDLGITADKDSLGINFIEIATSPWNKDVIYVMLTVPHHPEYAVLKYDGASWSNYSQGLPADEVGFSMIMDYQSNDGLYLSTNKRIYYREANPVSQWTPFKTGMPYVPAPQVEVNYSENTVRAGTFGRGIWKTGLKCPDLEILSFNNTTVAPGYSQAMTITATNTTIVPGKTIFRAANSITLNPNFIADASAGDLMFFGYIHGCSGPGNSLEVVHNDLMDVIQGMEEEELEAEGGVVAIPNPSNGTLTLSFDGEGEKDVFIYDLKGGLVFKKENICGSSLKVDISDQPRGVYVTKVVAGNHIFTGKILVQ